jgi:hypothetical protein
MQIVHSGMTQEIAGSSLRRSPRRGEAKPLLWACISLGAKHVPR